MKRLLEIYSPSGKEAEVGAFIANEMGKLGFKVRKDKVGNILGEVGNGKTTLLLCSHMDTVPGYIPVRMVDGKLYGRGAVDAKSPLAAMILAAHEVAEKISGKILVACAVDEERKSRGVKHLIREGLKADYAIFGEPSGTENIVIGYKGRLLLKITCKTENGHSATPWLFENSIEKAFEIWELLKGIHFSNEKLGSPFYSTTTCLIKIRGGEKSSKVPSKCEALIDIRIPPQLTCQQMYEEVSGKIKAYQKSNPKVSVDVKIEDLIEPFETDTNNRLVQVLSSTIRRLKGKQPMLLRKTGSGDMNFLGKALGIPIVTYGPGNSKLDHTSNEHVEIKEYLNSIQILKEALPKLF
ncbi:MAG: M20/M25/M40 family metallo-hydrolase [Candidatus Bathyarchaeia archaeon]